MVDPEAGKFSPDVEFSNWSGTHTLTCKCVPATALCPSSTTAKEVLTVLTQCTCKCRRVYEPETEEEVIRLMQKAIGEGWQLRVVGSGISPNAIGFSSKCMISMAQMDKVLEIDAEKRQVSSLRGSNRTACPSPCRAG